MTQLTINRNFTDDVTHIADDIQFYAELLRGIGYTREQFVKSFKATDVELFDNLLVHNRFNTTLEYSQYSGGKIADCHHEQRRLATKLRKVYVDKVTPMFMERAGIHIEPDILLTTITDETNEFMYEYEGDECEMLKFYANAIAGALKIQDEPKPSKSLIKRERTHDNSRIDKIHMYLEILLNDLRVPMYKLNSCGLKGIRQEMLQLTIFDNKCNTEKELAEYYGVSRPLIERRWLPILRAVKDYTAHVLAERFREKVDLPKYVKEYNNHFGMILEGSSYTSHYAEQLCGDYLKMFIDGNVEYMRDVASHLHLQLESE